MPIARRSLEDGHSLEGAGEVVTVVNLTRRRVLLSIAFVTVVSVAALVVAVGGSVVTSAGDDGSGALDDEALVHLDAGDWCSDCREGQDGRSSANAGDSTSGEPYTVDRVDGGPDVLDDGAARFSPDTGHLRVVFDEPLEGDFTLTASVRHSRQGYYAGVVTSESWQLMAPEGRYAFAGGGTHVQTDAETPDAWHTVTVVQRGDRLQLYVDGELVDTTRGADRSSANAILIGRRPGGYAFDGAIEAVTLHDRSLDPTEVQAMHAEQRAFAPIVYTDRFRSLAGLVVTLGAFVAAHVECRRRSPGTNLDHDRSPGAKFEHDE